MPNVTFNSTPAVGMYNLYPQAAAQMAVSDPNNPMFIGMYGLAQRSQNEYQQALARSMAAEQAMMREANGADLASHFIDHGADLSKAGISHFITPQTAGYLNLDQKGLAQADVQHLDDTAAEALQRRGTAIKDITEATGRPPTEAQMQNTYAGALGNPEAVPYLPKTQPTEGEIDNTKAQASMKSAEASAIRAAKGIGDTTTTIELYDPTTHTYTPMSRTIKGAPAQSGGYSGGAGQDVVIQMRATGQKRQVSPLVAQSLIKSGQAVEVK